MEVVPKPNFMETEIVSCFPLGLEDDSPAVVSLTTGDIRGFFGPQPVRSPAPTENRFTPSATEIGLVRLQGKPKATFF